MSSPLPGKFSRHAQSKVPKLREMREKIMKEAKALPNGWQQIVREHGLIEWVCPHGIGHPAPNEYQPKHMRNYPGHGCDGCCFVYAR